MEDFPKTSDIKQVDIDWRSEVVAATREYSEWIKPDIDIETEFTARVIVYALTKTEEDVAIFLFEETEMLKDVMSIRSMIHNDDLEIKAEGLEEGKNYTLFSIETMEKSTTADLLD